MTTFVHEGRRSYVVLFAVLAMIAALLALPATPAKAVATDACPATIPSAGFTDLTGYSQDVVDAANCLAFYGITKGTSATTYDPSGMVTRWQMALFLTRQAVDHGVTLPSGASQGFTDLAGLSAEAVTAINQLAQLNITKGTSATTFDPNGHVVRWQMALFITRLVSAAGITLPSGADQGFTDISGLSAEAQTAANQLKQLGISTGTTATTFDPNGMVTRAQMSLFLTRTLQAGGVKPPVTGTGQVVVTPSTQTTLSNGAARGYSATFKNADGSVYTGRVGIHLVDANTANAPIYNTDSATVTFQTVDGAAWAGDPHKWGGFAGSDGAVSFVVRHAGAAGDVVPVVWIDPDGDTTYETTGNVAPTEPYGLGGETDFSGAAAPEAANGTYNLWIVDSVDAAGDSFEASAVADTAPFWTFEYDSNDVFLVEGVVQPDIAGFEAALSETDEITITYFDTTAPTSTFEITTDETAASALKVTDPAAAKSIDSANYAIKGTGQVGATIRIYTDVYECGVAPLPICAPPIAPDDGGITGETNLGSTTVNSDGTWSVTVPLVQNKANNFVAWQRVAVGDTPTLANVPTITEGAPAAAKMSSSAATNGGTLNLLGPGDQIVITFNEKVAGVGTGDSIAIIDQDGSTATLTLTSGLANGDVGFSLDATGQILTLQINTFVFATGGTTTNIQPSAQITAITGFQGDDGLAIDVAGSGSGRVFGDGTPAGDAF